MNVLVIGGGSYVGSVLLEQLIVRGHYAISYDNLSRGHRAAVIPEAKLIIGELCERDKLVRTLDEHQIEAVVHLASDSLVSESIAYPHRYFSNNLKAGISLLDAMLEVGVKRLVFSSTCAVYGEPTNLPITEDLLPLPINPYGESMLAFERALRWYDAAYGLHYISLRCFNVAGATARHGEDHTPETHLIPLVLRVAAGKQEYLDVYGEDYSTPDGSCIRDYIHVADVAEAHMLALYALDRGNQIYNLGYGAGYSVHEVVEMARQVTGQVILTEAAPRRPGDPAILIASADRIMRDLGWQPRLSELDVIIESAWRWYLAHPQGYDNS